MHERGTVVSVSEGRIVVAIEPSKACETCGACAEGAGGKRILEGVLDPEGSLPGDTVEIETPAGARRRAQGLVYVVPVVALVAGYLAGFLLGTWMEIAPDAVGAVLAVLSGAAALLSLRWYDRSFEHAGDQPRVRAIIARGQSHPPGYPGSADRPDRAE